MRLLSEPGSEAAFPHPVDVVLNTHRVQAFEPDLFSNLGLDVAEYSVLMVKSSNHFFAGFSPIASQVLYVQQGPFFSNPHEVGYTKLRPRRAAMAVCGRPARRRQRAGAVATGGGECER